MNKPTRPQQPPVYRPQPTPKVLQRKQAPTAPPVYKPNPTARVLQPKAVVAHQPKLQTKRTPVAPPAYRPQPTPRVLQAKPASATQQCATPKAPPVYRPETKKAVQAKLADSNKASGARGVAPRIHDPVRVTAANRSAVVTPHVGTRPSVAPGTIQCSFWDDLWKGFQSCFPCFGQGENAPLMTGQNTVVGNSSGIGHPKVSMTPPDMTGLDPHSTVKWDKKNNTWKSGIKSKSLLIPKNKTNAKREPWKTRCWFHGTKRKHVEIIFNEGFDPERTRYGKQYGPGAYFTPVQGVTKSYGKAGLSVDLSACNLLYYRYPSDFPNGFYADEFDIQYNIAWKLSSAANKYKVIGEAARDAGYDGVYFEDIPEEWIIATVFNSQKVKMLSMYSTEDIKPDETQVKSNSTNNSNTSTSTTTTTTTITTTSTNPFDQPPSSSRWNPFDDDSI